MKPATPAFSPRRARWAWKLTKALSSEERGNFQQGLILLEQADSIRDLRAEDRVLRARLLLRSQRLEHAQNAFAKLAREFDGTAEPDLQYLRRYCLRTLALMRSDPIRHRLEVQAAKDIDCKPRLRRNFPLHVSEDS